MKIIAYCILHYGMPYFATAVEAIYPQVDKIVILYTASPSQGFSTHLPCPDTEKDLQDSVAPFMSKIEWVSGNWTNEGDHNDAIRQYQTGFDWIVRFDSDEIYPPGSVDYFIKTAEKTNAKIYRAPFLHFWRSFNKVCRDGQMPDRLIRVADNNTEPFAYLDDGYLEGNSEKYRIFHMGYAQPTKYIEYKMTVQGHKIEWRGDWLQTKWLPNAQIDVHPVVFNFWNTEPFDKNRMPDVLKAHPYFEKTLIE